MGSAEKMCNSADGDTFAEEAIRLELQFANDHSENVQINQNFPMREMKSIPDPIELIFKFNEVRSFPMIRVFRLFMLLTQLDSSTPRIALRAR